MIDFEEEYIPLRKNKRIRVEHKRNKVKDYKSSGEGGGAINKGGRRKDNNGRPRR